MVAAAKVSCFSKALLRIYCPSSSSQGRFVVRLPACSNKERRILNNYRGSSCSQAQLVFMGIADGNWEARRDPGRFKPDLSLKFCFSLVWTLSYLKLGLV